MKIPHSFTIVFFTITPFFLTAQSMVGDWTYSGPGPDGEELINTMSMKEDGSLSVDFGSDGQIEVVASYTIEGKQITINDVSEQSPCHGKAGVYEFALDGDNVTITLVEDACELRRRERPWVLTRKK
ncbi:hypothetical protein [Flavilitoribacter nigricans]|uniref:Lipocalin-like domain-containing protein n=1 Tax=Flavilitoribacter nigricans (strain ATCC 23147 / DSM 23189 / NBRC 102662 / NCIMB 1420 / SS-2) TaxID=1122177 RepID=A0A2D0N2X4_FLAN2|nr:hypothetical protein [Flavilitoribacter nigricans]PHN02489.1 hypothetical protein CRP01_31420 [Flavilitoribacter nigricans DSM 23189 = NBRC 102662]